MKMENEYFLNGKIHEECGVFGIYELLPAFLTSLAVCVVVSLVTPAPTADIVAEFDAAK